MTNDQARMTKEIQIRMLEDGLDIRASSLIRHWSFVISPWLTGTRPMMPEGSVEDCCSLQSQQLTQDLLQACCWI